MIPRLLTLLFTPLALIASPDPLPLVVGMELSYPPFEMTDTAGKPSGLSVDLATQLGQALHRPIKIENLAFDGLIPALMTKKIDLILSSLTVTEERSKAIQFSQPYAQIGLALLTRKDPTIMSAKDLNSPDRTVVTKRGTSGHLAVQSLFPKAKQLVVDKDAAAYMEISQGKADAFLYDQLSVARAQQRYPQTTQALLTPLRDEKWAIGLRKADHDLLQEINIFLISFRQQKGFDKLAKQYLAKEELLFREAGIPFIFQPTP